MSTLNTKQESFCMEYLYGTDCAGNASAAYRKVYDPDGKSKNIDSLSYQLMKLPHIKEFIAQEKEKIAAKYETNKGFLIGKHLRVVAIIEDLFWLLEQKHLTDDEEKRLRRLSNFFKGSDLNNSLIEIGKLSQLYVQKVDMNANVNTIRVTIPDEDEDIKELGEGEDIEDDNERG